MKYKGYSVTVQFSSQNMGWIIELVGKKHQDRFLDENDYLGEKSHLANLRLDINGLKRRIAIVTVVGLSVYSSACLQAVSGLSNIIRYKKLHNTSLMPRRALSVRGTLFHVQQLGVLPVITHSLTHRTLQNLL